MSKKKKEYKSFNYPNDLTNLEQYFYYLVEFGALPKELPPKLIETIFEAMAKDYLEGFIDIEKFESISSLLYFSYTVKQIGITREVDNLMAESADVTWYGDKAINGLTERLRNYYYK